MAVQIHFDPAGVPLLPHLILATKSGRMIREIPVNDVKFMDTLVSGSEFSFTVYREACLDENGGIDRAFWKKIMDFKLAYCRDFDRWYELKVDMTESTSTSRSVTARSLGEAELSQINVYGIEVNTETDIERADYEPTVLYDESHPEKSLIDRLLYKAPHYRVEHVDESIQNVQRTFSFDGKTIYDSFSEVSQEIGCLFLYDCTKKDDGGIDRTISVYDLEYHCPVCGQRGEYMPVCTNCGNTTLPGYGTDTTVFVARENLAKEITYTTNTDAVKNCFRLEAGDDLMTAGIVACNPNGSQYIWYITDDMKADMTSELQDKLADYDDLYEYYQSESSYSPPSGLLDDYNDIVEKYQNTWRPDTSLAEKQMPASIVGYPALMKNYFDTIDLQMFLENEMMPSSQTSTTDAETEAAKLTSISLSPVAVANITSCTADTAASAVVGMAKCIVRGTYQVKATESSIGTVGQFLQWTGKLRVTNYGDEEDTAETGSITVVITNDLQKYIQQKIDRMINQTADDPTDISALFKLDIAPFTAELSKYCRTRLIAFRDACQAALDILIQQGVADAPSWVSEEDDLYQTMYVPYLRKMSAIEAEIRTRSDEIGVVYGTVDNNGGILTDGMQTVLKKQVDTIRADLNFENYLGEELWQEFAGYRREDVYKNDNYISDGLSNYDLMIYAERFLNTARQEIFKSATMQHSIQASMANLLAMEEFQPLKQKFRVGNWIRVRADGDVYRLRLSEYTIDYSTWNLDVVFTDLKQGYSAASDLQSMLSAVKSMQTTYGSVTRQAKDGEKGLGMLDRWVNEGLALTTNIVGGAENQEFTMDESGFTGKELIPETGEYSPEQVKIISHGVYMTDDGWVTAKAALGRFRFLNPQNNFQEEEAFGVIADKLVGNLVLSQSIGIYNSDGSMTIDEDGFTLITEHTGNQKVFNIKRHNQDDSYDDIVSLDASGNLVLLAYSTTGDMNTAIEVSANGVKTYVSDNYSTKANTVKAAVVEYIVWDYGDDEHAPPNNDSHWSTATPSWTSGKYIWQHTKTTSGSDVISYSSPACIQGASGQSGQDGYNSAVVYLYQRATATPSAPSGSLTYTFSTGVLSGTLGSWSQDIQSGSNPIYVIAATAASRTDTDTIASNEWSTAVVLAQNGEDGDPGTNGLNSATVRLYQRAVSAPSKPSTALTYTFATGVLANIPTGWSQSIPASDGNPCWVTQATAVANTSTDTIAASEWSTVSKLVEDGEQGEDGIGISSIEPEYYLSTSDQEPSGGSWSTDQPEWENGKYIWTRSKITWDDSTQADPHIGYTDPVLASAINGANEQAYDTQQTLVTNYSTKTETKDLISTEVGRTTIELLDGVNTSSTNVCPYPLELQTGYPNAYKFTNNEDGTYTIEKLSSSTSVSFSIQNWGGSEVLLPAGTYTVRLYEDVKATNTVSLILSYQDDSYHSVSMTKTQNGYQYIYSATITLTSAITSIRFGVSVRDNAPQGYIRVWRIQVNSGSDLLSWESPIGAKKAYPTDNLCPYPMKGIYNSGSLAPIFPNQDGSYYGENISLSGTTDSVRLQEDSPGFDTGTYSVKVVETTVDDNIAASGLKFYNGSSEQDMTVESTEVETEIQQETIIVSEEVPIVMSNSTNLCPEGLYLSDSVLAYTTITPYGNGSYDFVINAASATKCYMWPKYESGTPILPAGTYHVHITAIDLSDYDNTYYGDYRSQETIKFFYGETTSTNNALMTKTLRGNNIVDFDVTITSETAIGYIDFTQRFEIGYHYRLRWYVQINNGSSQQAWQSPNGDYATLCKSGSTNVVQYPMPYGRAVSPYVTFTDRGDGSYTVTHNTMQQTGDSTTEIFQNFDVPLSANTNYTVRIVVKDYDESYDKIQCVSISNDNYYVFVMVKSTDTDGNTVFMTSLYDTAQINTIGFQAFVNPNYSGSCVWYPQINSGYDALAWEAPDNALVVQTQTVTHEETVETEIHHTKKTYTIQPTINNSASRIYFKKTGVAAGTYNFDWHITIAKGTEYIDWQPPTAIGVQYSISNAYSQINQTADQIELKVAKDGIISAINQSPEEITIDASRVNITGFLTISDVSSTGTVEIYGGRIKGGTITLGGNNNGNGQLSIVNASNQTLLTANNSEFSYYCRSSTSSFLIKNSSGNNLLEANTNGLTVYCRSTTAGLYLKDSSGNTIMASNSNGITLYKGSIQGPSIYVGGSNNGNGAIYVRNSSDTTIVTLNNSGIYTSNTTINADGISTSSLTASSYINFNCSNSSYLKVPYYSGNGYFELSSSNGFYSYCYGSTIQFGTNGHFNISNSQGTTGIYGENIVTNWISCYEIDATEMYASYVKPRVVDTPDFGKRLLYAFETPTPMFADVGSAVIDDTGTVYIFIDDIFAETVVTDIEYQVFIQKYGEGNCWVSERNPNYFTVSGTPGLEFGWEIHAKQVDTNQERLTPFIKGDKGTMRSMLKGNYDTLATDFIRKYYNEIETNEGSEI